MSKEEIEQSREMIQQIIEDQKEIDKIPINCMICRNIICFGCQVYEKKKSEENGKIRLQLMDMQKGIMLFDFKVEKEAFPILRDHMVEHLLATKIELL